MESYIFKQRYFNDPSRSTDYEFSVCFIHSLTNVIGLTLDMSLISFVELHRTFTYSLH